MVRLPCSSDSSSSRCQVLALPPNYISFIVLGAREGAQAHVHPYARFSNSFLKFWVFLSCWSWPWTSCVTLAGFRLKKIIILLFYFYGCFTTMSVYHVSVLPLEARRGLGIPCAPRAKWVIDPLEDQRALLTAEPSCQPLTLNFWSFCLSLRGSWNDRPEWPCPAGIMII